MLVHPDRENGIQVRPKANTNIHSSRVHDKSAATVAESSADKTTDLLGGVRNMIMDFRAAFPMRETRD
jgi:hypothetical protein